MSEIITIVVNVEAIPGKEQQLMQALGDVIAPSRAEPGCIEYRYHQCHDNPCKFVFYETWKNQAALDAHTETAHVKALSEKAKDLMAKPLEIIFVDELMPA